MKWFMRKKPAAQPPEVQLRDQEGHPFGALDRYVPLRRGELAWTLTRGRVLSFLRTGAEGSVLAAVNAGDRPEPMDLPWPARDWMTGAALEQGEQTLACGVDCVDYELTQVCKGNTYKDIGRGRVSLRSLKK